LAATYAPRNRYPQGPAGGMPMPFMPMYVQPGGQPNFNQQRGGPYPYQGQNFPPRGGAGSPRGMPFAGRGAGGAAGGPTPYGYPMAPYGGPQGMQQSPQGMGQQPFKQRMLPNGQPMLQQQPMGPGGQGGRRGPMGPGGRGPAPQGRGGYNMGGPMQQQMGPGGVARPGVKFNSNVRNQGGPMAPHGGMMPQPMAPQPMAAGMGEPLNDQALAQADPQQQKNMIGEKLYPLIYNHQPHQAGKITGMLLEMDNAELLNLIESPDALMHKIEEALIVLKNHQATAEE